MADVLKATLYAASGREDNAVDLEGGANPPARFGAVVTVAELKDANDSTRDRIRQSGDAINEVNGNGTFSTQWTLDSLSYSGPISFLRIRIRGSYANIIGSTGNATAQPHIAGVGRGTPVAFGTGDAWDAQDFTTDPADAAAWTQAKVNAQKMGWKLGLSEGEGTYLGVKEGRVPEFEVQVWGPDAQTSTPSVVTMAASVLAASVIVGAVLSACGTVPMTSTVNPATGVAGLRTVSPETVGMVATVDIDAVHDRTPASPDTVVPLAVFVDAEPTPVVLRSNTAPFGDQNLGTSAGVSTPASWPSSGTINHEIGGFADTGIAGTGLIGGVRFHAFARIRKDTNVTVSDSRIRVAGTFSVPLLSAPPTGPYSEVPEFGHVETAIVATSNGSAAWTWPTIFAALAGTRVGMDYVAGAPAIGEFAQLDLAEVWCEVMGPLGSPNTPILLRYRISDTLSTQTIQQTIEED